MNRAPLFFIILSTSLYPIGSLFTSLVAFVSGNYHLQHGCSKCNHNDLIPCRGRAIRFTTAESATYCKAIKEEQPRRQ